MDDRYDYANDASQYATQPTPPWANGASTMKAPPMPVSAYVHDGLSADTAQAAELSLMADRFRELADRLLGEAPPPAPTNTAQGEPAYRGGGGVLAGLSAVHERRDNTMVALRAALVRLEAAI